MSNSNYHTVWGYFPESVLVYIILYILCYIILWDSIENFCFCSVSSQLTHICENIQFTEVRSELSHQSDSRSSHTPNWTVCQVTMIWSSHQAVMTESNADCCRHIKPSAWHQRVYSMLQDEKWSDVTKISEELRMRMICQPLWLTSSVVSQMH